MGILHKAKILVVDDSLIYRNFWERLLAEHGHTSLILGEGREILKTVEVEKPALILLDQILPDGNGISFLKEIRKIYSSLELPVLMVTGVTDSNEMISALRAGANDYLTKPVAPDVALMRINVQLDLAYHSRLISQLRKQEGVKAAMVSYNHEINNLLTISLGNISLVMERYKGDEDLIEMSKAMWKISDILQKTSEMVKSNFLIEFDSYAGHEEKVKLTSND